MRRAISEEEFVSSKAELLKPVGQETLSYSAIDTSAATGSPSRSIRNGSGCGAGGGAWGYYDVLRLRRSGGGDAHLQACGVKCGRPAMTPHGTRELALHDPDGYGIVLHHRV